MAPWKELVAAGRRAAKAYGASQWELGDLALEVAPEKVATYADEIGVDPETLRQLRATAAAFPPAARVAGTSFSAHKALLSNPSLLTKGMTVTDAKKAAGHKTPPTRDDEPTPEQVVAKIKADPGLIEKAAKGDAVVAQAAVEAGAKQPGTVKKVLASDAFPEAKQAIEKAALDQAAEDSKKMVAEGKGHSPGLHQMADLYKVLNNWTKARRYLGEGLDTIKDLDLSDDDIVLLGDSADRVELILGWVQAYLKSGSTSWDDALDKLLKEDAQ